MFTNSNFLGNTQKQLSDFLFNCEFISQELYDKLNQFIEIKFSKIKDNIADLLRIRAKLFQTIYNRRSDSKSIQIAKQNVTDIQLKISEYYYSDQLPLFNEIMEYVIQHLPSILLTMRQTL